MPSPRIRPALAAVLTTAALAGCPTGDVPPLTAPDPGAGVRPVEYVDTLIGAGGVGFGIGAAFPGAAAPHGLVRLGPDTTLESGAMAAFHCAGYWYEDTHIEGFSHLHLHGTGIPDYGNVMFMPTVGMDATKTVETGYRSAFSHDDEVGAAGYYAVTLDDHDIRVELTATHHTGLQRYTFPSTDEAVVLLDLAHTVGEGVVTAAEVHLDPDNREITGYLHNEGAFTGRVGGADVWFVARFDRVPTGWGTFDGETLDDGDAAAEGADIGAWFRFDTTGEPRVQVQTGVSMIDLDHARDNLDAEHTAVWDFDAVRNGAASVWNDELARIEVTGGRGDERVLLYSMLYKALLMPTNYVEVGGDYRGFDEDTHYADGFAYYTDFSLWDTFRTVHPLYTLLVPDRQQDMLISFARMLEQGGGIPKWALHDGDGASMIGSPADQVIAGSYLKGIRDFGVDDLYDEMLRHAEGTASMGNRACMETYLALGYLPIDQCGDATSRTLEYAYNDFAVAQLAAALGHDEDADRLYAQAQSYRNLWNPETGFFQGKTSDGAWKEPFDPTEFADDYTEATAWQYRWHVQHDPDGLAELFGGADELAAELERMFEITAAEPDSPLPSQYYWHGNEPAIHAPWLGAELGHPEITQRWVRWTMEHEYGTGPDGLAGNDDGGTLASWYVFAALGLFPVPGTDRYLLGSPVFDRATLHLDRGDLVIEAIGAGPDAVYVAGVTLDGAPVDEAIVPHSALAGGGTLVFTMSETPTDWGR